MGQIELFQDVPAGVRVGGGGQGQFGNPLELSRDSGDLEIVGPEIMPPLGDAVGLVDGVQRDGDFPEEPLKAFRQQALWSDVQQVDRPCQGALFDAARLSRGKAGVQKIGPQAVLSQGHDLVLHQGDQRRHHDADPGAQDGRNLVADGLAAAGRHQDEGVLAAEHGFDDFQLVRAEGSVAVEFAKNVVRRRF